MRVIRISQDSNYISASFSSHLCNAIVRHQPDESFQLFVVSHYAFAFTASVITNLSHLVLESIQKETCRLWTTSD